MHRRLKVVPALLAALLLATGVAAGCGDDDDSGGSDNGGSSQSSEPTTVRLSIGPWVGYAAGFIAADQGFDEKNGIKIKTTMTTGGVQEQLATYQGGADAAAIVTQNVLAVQDQIPSKVVMFLDNSKDADAVLTMDGGTVADLKGKKIGLDLGGVDDLMLRGALDSVGLTPDDVEMLNIPGAGNSAALVSGKVGAAVTYEPYITNAQKKGAKVIYTAGEDPGIVSDVLVVKPDFAKEHPEAVVGLLKAWNEGVEFYRTNRQEAMQIVGKAIGAEPADLDKTFTDEKLEIYDLEGSNAYLASDFEPLATKLMGLMKDAGQLKTDVDVPSSYDTSYGEKAAAGN